MKIAILGAGAMGMLFGGFLSRENDVLLLEKDPARVAAVAASGVTVTEPDGTELRFSPRIASIDATYCSLDVAESYLRGAIGDLRTDCDLIERLARTPDFGMNEEELRQALLPERYTGRCAEQVTAFLNKLAPCLEGVELTQTNPEV